MHYIPDNTEFLANLSISKQPEEANFWPIVLVIVGGAAVAIYFYYKYSRPSIYSNLEDNSSEIYPL